MARPNTKQRPTWRRRADARPDEILTAALDEFIAKGFDSARIEDIAAKAGLSKGAVYLYFDSKEALLRALVERELAPVVARNMALAEAEAADPKVALAMLLGAIATVIGNPRIFAVPRLVISIAGRFPELRDHYRKTVAEPGRAAIERLIRRGIALGQFRDVDPVAATRAIIGPILFEALWTHMLGGESGLQNPAEFVRTQMDALTLGIGARA
jgi:AcrR family transcriptional regulator